ncbi:cell division protein FtsQ/DivIB [Aliifodinibius salicampi]|uniref:Cell division protein FtsQ/DivIB n=1 Tax=Fodinibius salicampi TaxID=1920655 RepID=A0ABT3PZA7_9BACT|nr:cell division protein FtsQ/DivIB [Fodinibius salicampi]MCW9713172.1 cell division protein FtsQ/DivIB [Fodinibius salicampi]
MSKKNSHNEEHSTQKRNNPLPWVGGAILILGLAISAGFYWSSMMTVQEVRFEDHKLVSEEKLREVEVPTGISPDSLNVMNIITQFEEIPYVERAAVDVEPNGNITIRISERQPIAMLVDGNQEMYIDKEGTLLPFTLGETVDVPLLYGFRSKSPGDTLKQSQFKAAADFLTELQNRPVSNATISEVAWTDNGIVALTNDNGVKVTFGKDSFGTRLRNWEAFYGEVIKQKGMEQMRSIDLRFEGQIVTREQ